MKYMLGRSLKLKDKIIPAGRAVRAKPMGNGNVEIEGEIIREAKLTAYARPIRQEQFPLGAEVRITDSGLVGTIMSTDGDFVVVETAPGERINFAHDEASAALQLTGITRGDFNYKQQLKFIEEYTDDYKGTIVLPGTQALINGWDEAGQYTVKLQNGEQVYMTEKQLKQYTESFSPILAPRLASSLITPNSTVLVKQTLALPRGTQGRITRIVGDTVNIDFKWQGSLSELDQYIQQA